MISISRRKYILDYLYKNGTVTRSELVKKLGVTAMTVGRDLKRMEEQGLLVRTHGGAVLPNYLVEETLYDKKKTQNIDIKKRIAKAALQYVHSGMTLLLDAGTTTFEIADMLKKSDWDNLTVITGDLQIGLHLYQHKGIQVFMLGGEVLTETGAVSGSIAIQQLERYAVDLSFVGTAAVTEEFYIVVPTESKAVFKEKIIAVSERAILVADQTKFHRKKMYKAARLEDLDFIITDYPFTAKEAAVSGLEGKIIKA